MAKKKGKLESGQSSQRKPAATSNEEIDEVQERRQNQIGRNYDKETVEETIDTNDENTWNY
jgi:hypothetical protein